MSNPDSLPGVNGAPRQAITRLDALVKALPIEQRRQFDRIFHLNIVTGKLVPPAAMQAWIATQFGSVDAVCQQRIVRVTNRVLLEGTLFNSLRANRPMQAPPGSDDLENAIHSSAGGSFCQPCDQTPADIFGRIEGRHSITASNIAKYDGWHGVIIFEEHHPLQFTAEEVEDYVQTGQEWARMAHAADPQACYPLFLWNCLWRSGASILHGHAQIVLAREMHYPKVEAWRQAALRYKTAHGANYFDNLITVHRALDLAIDHGSAVILPSLTPFKEKETHIIAPYLNHDLTSAIHSVLSTFVGQLGVRCFNLVLYQPPLSETCEDWSGFPFVVRILDRGNLRSRTSDVGSMEFFAQSVVATDPFRVAAALRRLQQE
jgi:galactose-1-phosphate uridylyltransferase